MEIWKRALRGPFFMQRISAGGRLMNETRGRKMAIPDAQLVVKLHRHWRRNTFTSAPRLIEEAIDIVALIDRERADDLRSRYGKPPGLFNRLLGFFFK
jgi:hypothetical protein